MTPEQERKLDHLVSAVGTLSTHVLGYHDRLNRLERGHKLMKEWLRRLLDGPPPQGAAPRPTLPSLSDDSGSIEITGWGASTKFHGKWPVRFALGFLVSAAMLVLGYLGSKLSR